MGDPALGPDDSIPRFTISVDKRSCSVLLDIFLDEQVGK